MIILFLLNQNKSIYYKWSIQNFLMDEIGLTIKTNDAMNDACYWNKIFFLYAYLQKCLQSKLIYARLL